MCPWWNPWLHTWSHSLSGKPVYRRPQGQHSRGRSSLWDHQSRGYITSQPKLWTAFLFLVVFIPSSSEKYRTTPSFASDISSAAYVATEMGSLRSGAHSRRPEIRVSCYRDCFNTIDNLCACIPLYLLCTLKLVEQTGNFLICVVYCSNRVCDDLLNVWEQ